MSLVLRSVTSSALVLYAPGEIISAITGLSSATAGGTAVAELGALPTGVESASSGGALTPGLEAPQVGNAAASDIGTLTVDHVDGEVPVSTQTPAGGSNRNKKRRYEVQVDDQIVTVGSPQEAFELLADIRKLATPAAVREVSAIVQKSAPDTWVAPPPVVEIDADAFDAFAGLRKALERTQRTLDEAYRQALRDAEIAYWMREMRERDDEEVLLLLH